LHRSLKSILRIIIMVESSVK
jgi:Dullard-like phosphatase family protein